MSAHSSADSVTAASYVPPATIRLNQYLLLAILYFFFNSFGLPLGFTYYIILSPLLWLWLCRHGQRFVTLKFAAVLFPFALAHCVDGVDSVRYYLQSTALLWATYITTFALIVGLSRCRNIDRIFHQLIVLNAFATACAVVVFVTPYREFMWTIDTVTFRANADTVDRLRLLNLEPSVYAFLMLPLMIFATLRLLRVPSLRNFSYLLMISVPFLLAQSFGGLSTYVGATSVAIAATYRNSLLRPKTIAVLGAIVVAVAGLIFVPSPIATRISQVLSGSDSSVDSRTVSSFVVAQIVVSHRSMWWGAGLGQAKLVELPNVGLAFTQTVIPNSVADAYAELGIIGVVAKLILEVYFFFRTRVYGNSFRLAMFVSAFILQLTGGYIEYVQEYLMWGLAFYPFFPEFSLRRPTTLPLHGEPQTPQAAS